MWVSAYFDEREIELSFPDHWQVLECRMVGHDWPALSDDELRAALCRPVGTARLAELARGARQVCIVFDDLTRPTPASRVIPFVLEELHAGGVDDECIRFLCAPGAHRPMVYPEMAAKLGRAIVEKYLVYNHSVWENLVHVGEARTGMPVDLNREYMACDLRIGIGSFYPHTSAVISGGAKLVVPGVAGMDTIAHLHAHTYDDRGIKYCGVGNVDGCEFRRNIEEAVRMAGLEFKIDVSLNNRREIVSLWAGDFVAEHRLGAEEARRLYYTQPAYDADVVVVNTYPTDGQIVRVHPHVDVSMRAGGDVVIVDYAWDGITLHQIDSRFGTDFGGRGFARGVFHRGVAKADRVYLLAPHLSRYDAEQMAPRDKLVWCKEWGEVLTHLTARHGTASKVAVYPYAPLQIVAPAY